MAAEAVAGAGATAGMFAAAGPYGALISGASSVLGSALARPPENSTALSGGTVNSWFDGSGWTVATGKASAKGGDRSEAFGGINPFVLAAGVVALLIWKWNK